VATEVVEHEKPAAKEIRIRVEWLTKAGQPDRPVQLVAWKYRREPERVP
jgi:hypothetical protein